MMDPNNPYFAQMMMMRGMMRTAARAPPRRDNGAVPGSPRFAPLFCAPRYGAHHSGRHDGRARHEPHGRAVHGPAGHAGGPGRGGPRRQGGRRRQRGRRRGQPERRPQRIGGRGGRRPAPQPRRRQRRRAGAGAGPRLRSARPVRRPALWDKRPALALAHALGDALRSWAGGPGRTTGATTASGGRRGRRTAGPGTTATGATGTTATAAIGSGRTRGSGTTATAGARGGSAEGQGKP